MVDGKVSGGWTTDGMVTQIRANDDIFIHLLVNIGVPHRVHAPRFRSQVRGKDAEYTEAETIRDQAKTGIRIQFEARSREK